MRFIIVFTSLFIFHSVNAQKVKASEVPKEVMVAFQEKYKGAKAEKWEKENENYEVEFDLVRVPMNDPKGKKVEVDCSALFTSKGEFLEVEEEISVKSIPADISEYITKNYSGYKMDEATKITDNKNVISFEVEVEKGKEEFELFFDEKGNFIKKEEKKEDKGDD